MGEHPPRTAAPRDVPPPRPVAPAAAPVEETALGRAARAVAEAVAGLVGSGGPAAAGTGRPEARSGRGVLRDALGAVAGAMGAAMSGRNVSRPSSDQGDGPGSGTRPPPAAGPATDAGSPPGAMLDDLLSAVAPRLPIRSAERLRRTDPGATDAEIAERLVARAARLTAGIGAATGGITAARWFAPSSLLVLPLELGAETVLTAAVEVVLVGELHELHGRPAPGDARARGAAYLAGWSAHRPGQTATGAGSMLAAAGLQALRRRVGGRLGGTVPAAAPLLGAALAGRSNRRATELLAGRVLRDLRGGD